MDRSRLVVHVEHLAELCSRFFTWEGGEGRGKGNGRCHTNYSLLLQHKI